MKKENSPRVRLVERAASPKHIRARLAWLVWDKGVLTTELPKVGKCMTPELVDFCTKHPVSLDWLLCGDMRGLLQMARGEIEPAVPKRSTPLTTEEIAACYATLPLKVRQHLSAKLGQLVRDALDDPA